jgi:hypothetical protein
MHGDGVADDGVYANYYRDTRTPGSYTFSFRASGTNSLGEPFTREDKQSAFVELVTRNVGVSEVLRPTGTIYAGSSVTPEVVVSNYGTTSETFPMTLHFGDYASTKTITGMPPNTVDTVQFDPWVASVGSYVGEAYTQLAGDGNRSNDTSSVAFEVILPPGWYEKEAVPTTPGSVGIKDGGALTALGSAIYALQGGNSSKFLRYDVASGLWTTLAQVPPPNGGISPGLGVRAGGALTTDGVLVYALAGGNTNCFLGYSPGTQSWQQLTSVPGSAGVNSGGALATLGQSVYALKGGNTKELWRYDLVTAMWTQCRDVPAVTGGVKGGGALAVAGGVLYAFEGGNTPAFYGYLPASDSWIRLADAHFGGDKSIFDGAAMAVLGESLYAFKGGNTYEFGCYDIATDTWYTLDAIPGPVTVNHGGALAATDYGIYALKGGNSKEFWRFGPGTGRDGQAVTTTVALPLEGPAVSLGQATPSPSFASVRISYEVRQYGTTRISVLDVSGREVRELYRGTQGLGVQHIEWDGTDKSGRRVSPGVYFVRLDMDGLQTQAKVLMLR